MYLAFLLFLFLSKASGSRTSGDDRIRCWPITYRVEGGTYLISQNLTFTMVCEEFYTRPLLSAGTWHCVTGGPLKVSSLRLHTSIAFEPQECVKKFLPEYIYLNLEISLAKDNLSMCNSVEKAVAEHVISKYMEKSAPIGVDQFHFVPTMTKESYTCSVHYRQSGGLQVRPIMNLRLIHRPKEGVYSFPPHVLSEARKQFLKFGKEIEGEFEKKAGICAAGWFLNADTGRCQSCDHGFYNNEPGATKCKACPNVHKFVIRYADAMSDCYLYDNNEIGSNTSSALKKGFFFFITYHLLLLLVVIWNVRFVYSRNARQAHCSTGQLTDDRDP